MNYSWAADMVNHQQSSNKENVGVNKYNDEKLTAIVNTLIPIEDESASMTPQAPIVQGWESAVPNKELYKMIYLCIAIAIINDHIALAISNELNGINYCN